MFTGFDEKNKSKITLQDVDPHALEILVNYVYTSEVDVTEDNVQTLLPAANLMQLSGLLEEFSTQLRTKISSCLSSRLILLFLPKVLFIHRYT